MKVIVTGDIHGDWAFLNTFINKKKPDIILCCGDFGFFPKELKFDLDDIKNGNTKIYWCEGNHEDHWSLNKLTSNEIRPNIFYQPRGRTLTLNDGRRVLFFGGADSIDKRTRTLGRDWFPEEVPSYQDFLKLDEIKERIDIVISHTCPNEFEIEKKPKFFSPFGRGKSNDPTREVLSRILDRFRPSLWYFGHWHFFTRGKDKDCFWTALNMCPETNWWKNLE